MFGIGAPELIVILVIALVIFGPGKLPEIGSALGRSVRDFKKSFDGIDENLTRIEATSQPLPRAEASAPVTADEPRR